MILSEKMDKIFSTTSAAYRTLSDPLEIPDGCDSRASMMEYAIKDDAGAHNIAYIGGVADPTNSQFIIERLDVSEDAYEDECACISVIKRLLNTIITNLEMQALPISVIYFPINKQHTLALKAALDTGFTVDDENNTYGFNLIYYLSGFPLRQSYNTAKVMSTVRTMANNSSEY